MFSSAPDGTNPASGPIFDSHGNPYGTTVNDGAFRNGTIYELSPASHGHWKYTVLHEFRLGELEGSGFNSGLVFDKAGNLYGTAWSTGGYGDCTGSKCGVIYKLSPGQHERWKYTELYTFTGGSDGGDPEAISFSTKTATYMERQKSAAPMDWALYSR